LKGSIFRISHADNAATSVSESSSDVFLPGSSHPSAILFDSSEHFAKKSAKADEGIRAIKKNLAMAVDTCITAAAYEWDVGWQRRLLRVSSERWI